MDTRARSQTDAANQQPLPIKVRSGTRERQITDRFTRKGKKKFSWPFQISGVNKEVVAVAERVGLCV